MISHLDLADQAIDPLLDAFDEIDGRVGKIPFQERHGVRKALGGVALVFFAAAGCAGDKCANSCEQAINDVNLTPIVNALMGGVFVAGLGYSGRRIFRSRNAINPAINTYTPTTMPQLVYEDYQDSPAGEADESLQHICRREVLVFPFGECAAGEQISERPGADQRADS